MTTSELSVDDPHDGWTRLPAREGLASFVASDPTGARIRVAYFCRDADLAMVGRACFGPLSEGPPRHVHGGALAAVLDEAMGAGAWLAGHRVVAAKIEVEYRRPVPLGALVTFTAWVERVDGKRVFSRAELRLPDGEVATESTGLFIVIDFSKLRNSAT